MNKTPTKLFIYTYECTNKQGRKITGDIEAINISMAKALLRKQELTPIKVQPKSATFFSFKSKKISALEICNFSRQMATMASAGVPLVQSFDIIERSSENVAFKELIVSVKTEVEAGLSFADALKKFPAYFDELFCNLVAAGEVSGSLETMLDRIATYKEKTESLKRKIKKALMYPTAVLIIAIIVTVILLVFVVPQFEELFKGFGAELPVFTLAVISVSTFLQDKWFIMAGLLILCLSIFKYFKKHSIHFNHFLDRSMLKLPIIGSILHKAAIARYARTLSTTFAAGVPLIEALESVAGASGNIVYQTAILNIRDEVSTGSQMQFAMKNTNVFPNMVIQMVAIGEESGSLDKMLTKVALIYEEEVDSAVDGLSSLLEPLIMVFLGILVGGLVIAMYLPIFKMGSVI